jgi:glucose-1-phosphate adenylyltransferase
LDSAVTQSTIGDGCFIEKSTIKNAMVGLRSHISEGCVIEDTLLMGADFYENKAVCASKDDCFMPLGVGPGSTIKNAIVDKNARIGANCSITNKNNVETDVETGKDAGWVIKDYIIVIEKDATIPDGTVI